MASAADVPEAASSFVYEDLISQVETIQNQMSEIENILDDQWKDGDTSKSEIKSRCLCFIDPYGNKMIDEYMDHESIHKIIEEYKQNFVPKYLQQWIKIGSVCSSTKYRVLRSTISDYADGYQFITYGEVTVWFGRHENPSFEPLVLEIRLMDNMEEVKMKIKKLIQFTTIELKLWTRNPNEKPNNSNWNQGKTLKSEDTIMSCHLYRDNCAVLVKLDRDKILWTNPYTNFRIRVQRLTGQRIDLFVNSTMSIATVKELIHNQVQIYPDQQRLIFAGKQLSNERTLQDYNIQHGSLMHLLLRLRGGMYHFTSGRQDFQNMPSYCTDTVKHVFMFELKNMSSVLNLPSAELQKFVFQAQTALSNLYDATEQPRSNNQTPNLRTISLQKTVHDEHDDNNDNVANQQ